MQLTRRRPAYATVTPPLIRLMAGGPRQLVNPSMLALELAQNRLLIITALFMVLFSVLVGRLANLTLFTADEEPARRSITTSLGPDRADIVDRNGTVLASSLPTTSTCLNARVVIEPERTVDAILTVIPGLDRDKILTDVKDGKRCVMLDPHLTPRQHSALNSLGIVGLEFMPSEKRYYPAGMLTTQLMGFTDTDNQGIAGLEKSSDKQLRQSQTPLTLALDLRVQQIVQNELARTIEKFHAIGGAGIVMDIDSGEVIAMSSLPTLDRDSPKSQQKEAVSNRATLGVYELGSIFKIFTAAQALDLGEVRLSDTFDATHPLQVGHEVISDYHPENRWLNLPEILIHSSNIGAARIADLIGAARQRPFMKKLGLFDPSPVEIPEVGRPMVPNSMSDITTMTISYGHGIAVSPMQLVSAVASIVNGGTLVKATLFKKDGTEPKGERIISANTSAKIRAMLRLVVTEGTAGKADAHGYVVGGKTGTAEKISGRTYNKDSRIASFVGVFPAHKPKYVVFVMVDEPQGTKETYGFATAGWVAAPAVGTIVSAAAPLLGISPLDETGQKQADAEVLRPLGTLATTLVKQAASLHPHDSIMMADHVDQLAAANPSETH